MSCDHQFVNEHVNGYLENKTSTEINSQLEQKISHCSDCLATYQQCQELYQMANNWQPQEVPEWHRTRFAVRPPVRTSNWLNWSALASSTLAILMVVFQLEINSGDSGLMISFGGNQNEAKVTQMVAAHLAAYKEQQDNAIQLELAAAFERQEDKTSLHLASWIEKNRDERQQEIKFVMRGWQSQRFDDQQKVDRQLSYMADNQIENNQAINQLFQSITDDSINSETSSQPNKL